MATVSHEVFDCDVVEGVSQKYFECVFFDCRFTGRGNTYRRCRFQNTFGQPVSSSLSSTFTECLFAMEES